MACKCTKKYSVYFAKDDRPLILYATSKECAKAMGITLNSFHRYIVRMKHGIKMRKWAVYEDEVGEEE